MLTTQAGAETSTHQAMDKLMHHSCHQLLRLHVLKRYCAAEVEHGDDGSVCQVVKHAGRGVGNLASIARGIVKGDIQIPACG